MFSPVRLHFGKFTANEIGRTTTGKTVSGITQEPEPEEETRIGAEASGVTTQWIAQGSAARGGGRGWARNQTTSHETGGGNQPGLPATHQITRKQHCNDGEQGGQEISPVRNRLAEVFNQDPRVDLLLWR